MHRRPKPSLILGAVAVLAVTSPIAVYTLSGTNSTVQAANESTVAVPTTIVKMALASAPDITIPIRELTGLNLPDINLSELSKLVPSTIALPAIPGITVPNSTAPTAQTPPPPLQTDVSAPAAGGAVVKEVTQDTPFSMVALTANELQSASAQVRAQLEDGSWGPWNETLAIDSGPSDAVDTPATVGTEPIYVGLTKRVQILLTPTVPPVDPAAVPMVPAVPAPVDVPEQQPLGYIPSAVSSPLRSQSPVDAPAPVEAPVDPAQPVEPAPPVEAPASTDVAAPANPLAALLPVAQAAADATAVLITPGTSPADATLAESAAPISGSGPKIITRAQWGADESQKCSTPTYDDSLGGATVHHTAGSNDYTKDESAGIVRAIYAYHAKTLGWCDIGYNALVDKYGQIFEGRAGGLDKNVQGAHAGGFNENTTGVAMMGNYTKTEPSQVMLDSVGQFLGWRLGLAGLDPEGKTTMTSEGTRYTFVKKGASIELPVIFAHRDVGDTECPGDAAYSHMGEIRDIAKAYMAGKSAPAPADTAPVETPPAETPPVDSPPVDTLAAAPEAALPSTDASSAAPGAAIPGLLDQLVRLTDPTPVAQKWVADGGETGKLGAALTGLLPAAKGQTRADFTNGAIYTNAAGTAFSVFGKIFDQFRSMGADGGSLGLPTSDEYKIPGGSQSDFENGSLIFNEVTGIVTVVLKTFIDTYQEQMATPAG